MLSIFVLFFFILSFQSQHLAFVLTQNLKTSVGKDHIASEGIKINGLSSVLEKCMVSKILAVFSLDCTVQTLLLPDALLIVLLWSYILITHFF